MKHYSEITLRCVKDPGSGCRHEYAIAMRACVENGYGDSKDTIQHDGDLEDGIRCKKHCRMASRNDWFTKA